MEAFCEEPALEAALPMAGSNRRRFVWHDDIFKEFIQWQNDDTEETQTYKTYKKSLPN